MKFLLHNSGTVRSKFIFQEAETATQTQLSFDDASKLLLQFDEKLPSARRLRARHEFYMARKDEIDSRADAPDYFEEGLTRAQKKEQWVLFAQYLQEEDNAAEYEKFIEIVVEGSIGEALRSLQQEVAPEPSTDRSISREELETLRANLVFPTSPEPVSTEQSETTPRPITVNPAAIPNIPAVGPVQLPGTPEPSVDSTYASPAPARVTGIPSPEIAADAEPSISLTQVQQWFNGLESGRQGWAAIGVVPIGVRRTQFKDYIPGTTYDPSSNNPTFFQKAWGDLGKLTQLYEAYRVENPQAPALSGATRVTPNAAPEIERTDAPARMVNPGNRVIPVNTETLVTIPVNPSDVEVAEETLQQRAQKARTALVELVQKYDPDFPANDPLALGVIPFPIRKAYFVENGYPEYSGSGEENPVRFKEVWENDQKLIDLYTAYRAEYPEGSSPIGRRRGTSSVAIVHPDDRQGVSEFGLLRDGQPNLDYTQEYSQQRTQRMTVRTHSMDPLNNYMVYHGSTNADVQRSLNRYGQAMTDALATEEFRIAMTRAQREFFDGGIIEGGVIGFLKDAFHALFHGGKDQLTVKLEKVFGQTSHLINENDVERFIDRYNAYIDRFAAEQNQAYRVLERAMGMQDGQSLDPADANVLAKVFGIGADRARSVPFLKANNNFLRRTLLYRREAIFGLLMGLPFGQINVLLGMVKNPWAIEDVFRGPGIDSLTMEFMGVRATDVLEEEIIAAQQAVGTGLDRLGEYTPELQNGGNANNSRIEGSDFDASMDEIYAMLKPHLDRVGLRYNQQKGFYIETANLARKRRFTIWERIIPNMMKNLNAKRALKRLKREQGGAAQMIADIQEVYDILRTEFIDDFGVTPEGELQVGHEFPTSNSRVKVRWTGAGWEYWYHPPRQNSNHHHGTSHTPRPVQYTNLNDLVERAIPSRVWNSSKVTQERSALLQELRQLQSLRHPSQRTQLLATLRRADGNLPMIEIDNRADRSQLAELHREGIVFANIIATRRALTVLSDVAEDGNEYQAAAVFVLERIKNGEEGFRPLIGRAASPRLNALIAENYYNVPDGQVQAGLQRLMQDSEFRSLMTALAKVQYGDRSSFDALVRQHAISNVQAQFQERMRRQGRPFERANRGAYGPDLREALRGGLINRNGQLNRRELYKFYRDAHVGGVPVGATTLAQLQQLTGVDISADEFLQAIQHNSQFTNVRGMNTAFNQTRLPGGENYNGPGIMVNIPNKTFVFSTPNGDVRRTESVQFFIKPGCANLGILCDGVEVTEEYGGPQLSDHMTMSRHARIALYYSFEFGGDSPRPDTPDTPETPPDKGPPPGGETGGPTPPQGPNPPGPPPTTPQPPTNPPITPPKTPAPNIPTPTTGPPTFPGAPKVPTPGVGPVVPTPGP